MQAVLKTHKKLPFTDERCQSRQTPTENNLEHKTFTRLLWKEVSKQEILRNASTQNL